MNTKALDFLFSMLYFFIAFYGFRTFIKQYTGSEDLSLTNAILSGVVGGVAVAVIGYLTQDRKMGSKIIAVGILLAIAVLANLFVRR